MITSSVLLLGMAMSHHVLTCLTSQTCCITSCISASDICAPSKKCRLINHIIVNLGTLDHVGLLLHQPQRR